MAVKSSSGERSGSDPVSSCRALLVSDPTGLMVAPLDATDLEPIDVVALVAALDPAGTQLPLGARAVPTVARSAADARLTPQHPLVLRHQDDSVLAWHEPGAHYVALGPAHLAVLDQLRHEMSVQELDERCAASDWPDGLDIAAAVAQLASIGLLEASDPVHSADALGSDEPERLDPPSDAPPAAADEDAADEDGDVPDEVGSDAAVGDDLRHEQPVAADAPPSAGRARDIGLFEGLPSGRAAARVVAYRAVGRSRRLVRRGWITAGRQAAVRLEGHFGKESDDWPDPPAEQSVEHSTAADEAAVVESHLEPDPIADPSDTPAGTDLDGATIEVEAPPPDAAELDAADLDAAGPAVAEPGSPGPTVLDHRTPVFGVYHSPEHNANLGLGLIVAHCRAVRRGALNTDFDLRRASIDAEPMLTELGHTGRQAVVLFSDYMWSVDHNLEVCARVKALSPSSVTVHGGPHAPKYEAEAERFLLEHPHVDVLVRGEGELTVAALLEALGPHPDPDRLAEVLADVEGLTFVDRSGDAPRVVRTPDRARATDVGEFPSPYLTGEFDDIDPARWRSATVETNRGCPYGCTFCDWGSATNSRIRQFDRDRVFAELEWLASRGISEVFLADANFGLFARDVEVAQHIAELKQRYGAPMQVICSFAKNTVKYTTEIVRIWVEAGICAEGSVALQTTDEVTLENVERSNIKVAKYDALAEEFRRHRLPIVTDLLMGLPGATVDSFKNDLQRCLDQEVTPRMMETVLLPNSPMNAPEYRERFQIEVDAANVLVSTSSYTRDDFEEMKRLRLLFRACEHYGLLRHLFRWLQVEHGLRALDVLHDIDRVITDSPERFPLLTWVGRYFDLVTAPPGGWPPFYDEVVALLDERYGIRRDAAMDTVLQVQCFLMPTQGRRFPAQLSLEHDYVTWYHETSRWSGVEQPRRLIEMGPGQLIVDDPAGVCDARLLRNGFSIRREEACDNPFWVLNDWELDSELARPMATAVPLLASP